MIFLGYQLEEASFQSRESVLLDMTRDEAAESLRIETS